jgi:hypothetical protein
VAGWAAAAGLSSVMPSSFIACWRTSGLWQIICSTGSAWMYDCKFSQGWLVGVLVEWGLFLSAAGCTGCVGECKGGSNFHSGATATGGSLKYCVQPNF